MTDRLTSARAALREGKRGRNAMRWMKRAGIYYERAADMKSANGRRKKRKTAKHKQRKWRGKRRRKKKGERSRLHSAAVRAPQKNVKGTAKNIKTNKGKTLQKKKPNGIIASTRSFSFFTANGDGRKDDWASFFIPLVNGCASWAPFSSSRGRPLPLQTANNQHAMMSTRICRLPLLYISLFHLPHHLLMNSTPYG